MTALDLARSTPWSGDRYLAHQCALSESISMVICSRWRGVSMGSPSSHGRVSSVGRALMLARISGSVMGSENGNGSELISPPHSRDRHLSHYTTRHAEQHPILHALLSGSHTSARTCACNEATHHLRLSLSQPQALLTEGSRSPRCVPVPSDVMCRVEGACTGSETAVASAGQARQEGVW